MLFAIRSTLNLNPQPSTLNPTWLAQFETLNPNPWTLEECISQLDGQTLVAGSRLITLLDSTATTTLNPEPRTLNPTPETGAEAGGASGVGCICAVGLTGYSQVDKLGLWYKSVNLGVKKDPSPQAHETVKAFYRDMDGYMATEAARLRLLSVPQVLPNSVRTTIK